MFIIVRSLESNFCTRSKILAQDGYAFGQGQRLAFVVIQRFPGFRKLKPCLAGSHPAIPKPDIYADKTYKRAKRKTEEPNRKKRTLLLPLLPSLKTRI